MSNASKLWTVVYDVFEYHRFHPEGPDPDAQYALDRVVTECLGFKRMHRINSSTFDVHEELLGFDQLRALIKYHHRKEPLREVEPIVVLESNSHRWLIDGHNRVNKWLVEAPQQRRAIVLSPRHAA